MQLQGQTAAGQAGNGTALLDLLQTNSNSSEGQSTSFDVLELMRQRLPVYVVNCLLAAGYDVIEVISNMDVSENPGNTINKIENFIERNFPGDCRYVPSSLTHSTEHSQHLAQHSTKLTANFEFPPGHRERICSFIQEVRAKVTARSVNETCKEKPSQLHVQKSLDTSGKESKRKRHYDNDDIPNQIKSRIPLSEDDNSSEEAEVSVATISKQVRDNIRIWVRGQRDPKLKNLIEGKHYNLQVTPDVRNPRSFLASIRCLSCNTYISLHQRNRLEKQSPFLISNWVRHWKNCDVTAVKSKFQQPSLHCFLSKSLQHSCVMTKQLQGSSAMSKQLQGSCDTTKQVVINRTTDPLSIQNNSPDAPEACSSMEDSSLGIKEQIVDFTDDESITACNHCNSPTHERSADNYHEVHSSNTVVNVSGNQVFQKAPPLL